VWVGDNLPSCGTEDYRVAVSLAGSGQVIIGAARWVDQVTSPTCRSCTNVAKRFLATLKNLYPPGRQSYQPKTVGPAIVGVIRIKQRRCLIMAVR
jgi:hypothetical protein